MTLVEFDTPINGNTCHIKMETDPTWGEFEQVIKTASVSGSSGYTLFLEITKAVVKDGLPFDKKSPTAWAMLPLSETTKLIGQVMQRFPLVDYLDNLGKDNPIFQKFLQ